MDGAKLMKARLRKGLTQEELAEAMHVGVSSIRRWEKGECIPQPIHRQKLCDVLDLTELPGTTLGVPTEMAFALPQAVLPAPQPKQLQAFM